MFVGRIGGLHALAEVASAAARSGVAASAREITRSRPLPAAGPPQLLRFNVERR
jgi:hypothetical protein